MTTMKVIESQAEKHAAARDALVDEIQAFQDEQEKIKRRRLKGLRAAARKFQDSRNRLLKSLNQAPELFKRPKTRTLHGLRVGFMKQKGKVLVKNPDQTVAKIKSAFPKRAADLINTTEKPSKTELSKLSGTDLKRLGVEVTADTDEPVAKSTDSEINKLLNALTDDALETEDL